MEKKIFTVIILILLFVWGICATIESHHEHTKYMSAISTKKEVEANLDKCNTNLENSTKENEEKDKQLKEKDTKIAELEKQITQLQSEIETLKKKLAEQQQQQKSNNTSANVSGSTYRLTSFWSGDNCDTGSCTGSGLCEKDFDVNENGWYTYQGKLVLGVATRYLLKYGYAEVPGIRYFKYYDTLTLNINGKDYEAIVLDSCGACMKKNILDLFVSNSNSSITTNVTIK